MEYYIAKGQRRREERAAASTAETYRPSSFQMTETKSLETSTTSNTLITTTSYDYDDSDDELGAEIYKSSLTAKRLREEQNQVKVSSTQTTATRRKSSRSKPDTKSRKDTEKESVVCSSKTTSTANKETDKRVIRSNKRKAAVLSTYDEIVMK